MVLMEGGAPIRGADETRAIAEHMVDRSTDFAASGRLVDRHLPDCIQSGDWNTTCIWLRRLFHQTSSEIYFRFSRNFCAPHKSKRKKEDACPQLKLDPTKLRPASG